MSFSLGVLYKFFCIKVASGAFIITNELTVHYRNRSHDNITTAAMMFLREIPIPPANILIVLEPLVNPPTSQRFPDC